jgi:hypothetical protein
MEVVGMKRRLRVGLRTLALAGLAGAFLLGNLTGAQADTSDAPAAEPTANP